MHLKSLFLAGLVTFTGFASATTSSAYSPTQQITTAQGVLAIKAAAPAASFATPRATLSPTHQGVPRFIGELNYQADAVLIGTVLTVLILGMWFGRCSGNRRRE